MASSSRIKKATPITRKGPARRRARGEGDPVRAQVLFMDIVGFTRRQPRFQVRLARALTQIVQRIKVRDEKKSRNRKKPWFLPTGDGMVIVFFEDEKDKSLPWAEQIVRALTRHNRGKPKNLQLHLRMGINHGRVFKYVDINDRINVAGTAINKAQRVMDFGGKGHILIATGAWEELDDDLGTSAFENRPLI